MFRGGTSGESEFADWLANEILQCGWSLRELARRSELAQVTLADLLTGAQPTWEQCARLGHTLRMSPVTVFRKAGLLPVASGTRDERLVEALETLSLVPEGAILHEATEAIRAVAQHACRRVRGARTRDEHAI